MDKDLPLQTIVRKTETIKTTPDNENAMRLFLLNTKRTGTLKLHIAGGRVQRIEFESNVVTQK